MFYNKFIIFLYMFQALLCSSSGGQIVLYSIWHRQTCRWPSCAQVGIGQKVSFFIHWLWHRLAIQIFVTVEVQRLLQKDLATSDTWLVLLLGVTKSTMGNLSVSRVSYPLSHVWYGCLGRFGDRIPTLCACYHDSDVM